MAQIHDYHPKEYLREHYANTQPNTSLRFLATLILLVGCLSAAASDAVAETPPTPFVTGTLNLVVDTHFISYGQDVWAAGNSWSDPLFHPSLELNFDLGRGFKGTLGTWWDVNDNASSSIGGAIQEIDVWSGLSYGVKDWNFFLLYQELMYASQSERIIDFKTTYSHWLNPNLVLHARVDGAKPFDTGLALVLGIAPSKRVSIVTIFLPVNVAFDTHNFHGGDAGFSFVSVGVGASVPLKFIRGNWSFNVGVNYYHTNPEVIPVNPKSNFLTGSAGITLLF